MEPKTAYPSLSRPRPPRSSIIHNLLERETCGKFLQRLSNPFGKGIPDRMNMPMESVLPIIALQNGHIFLGFTDCGRFLLSYTIREEFESAYNRNEMAFFYKLHIWLFTPHKLAKRVGSVILFSNAGVADNNLLIDVSQWQNDDSKLVILGRNYSPEIGGFRSLYYVTMTTLPSTSCCADCNYLVAPNSEELFDVHGLLDKGKCLIHSVTTHLVYERVPPFPKFNFDIQLRWKNSIVLNTGNALHIFTYNISGPQQESVFIPELLNPPHHNEPRKSKSKTRFLRCDFWFKLQLSNCLQKILSNCSAFEASRIHTAFENKTEEINKYEERNVDCLTEQETLLSNLPFFMDFSHTRPSTPHVSSLNRLHSRRLSQSSTFSSADSEISVLSSMSLSTNFSQSTQDNTEGPEAEAEQPMPSPPKRTFLGNPCEVRKVMSSMPPPLRRRKFFKTGHLVTNTKKNIPRITRRPTQSPIPNNSFPKQEKTYDIFDVGVEEVLLERSLSSYRKRRNADKQYEFADPDVSAENLVPLKLCRKRARGRFPSGLGAMLVRGSKSPRSVESSSPTHGSTNYEGFNLGPSGYPRSPRALTVHSPAISPSYSEVGDILRPLTNYTNVNQTSPNPLFSPPPFTREFCDDSSIDSKLISRQLDNSAEVTIPDVQVEKYSSARPTFTTNVNCIAKILRCYVDKDDDNQSVKTDTDDEYSVTVPFPVALNLDVHGSGYQNLQLIHNSKAKSSPNPVVEVLQRTLEIEILCNEVAGMICLSADKNFISCFDYDVAILDVCPEKGSITAVAVVLIHAVNLSKENAKDLDSIGNESSQNSSNSVPNLMDLRQKYEAIFSFVWDAVKENCRIFHMGHMREVETTPENWHPTKQILQRLEDSLLLGTIGARQRVLSNELAVFEWQSLDELVDPTGLIRLCSGSSKSNTRDMSATAFSSLGNLDTEDDDEDLSD